MYQQIWKVTYTTFIAAAQGSSVVSSSAKVDFLKLQNGRYNNVHSLYDLHPLV